MAGLLRFLCLAWAMLEAAPGVLKAQEPAVAPAPTARISGVVFDSVSMRPLAAARVQLWVATDPSLARFATTDDSGTFRFDSVAVGTWLVGFYHPALNVAAVESPLVRVDVRSAGDIRVLLVIPSGATLVARLCRTDVMKDSLGLYTGFLSGEHGEQISQKGHVVIRWSEVTVGRRGIERHSPTIDAETSDLGGFTVCGVPVGALVLVRAWAGSDSSGFVELELPPNGFLRRDLIVGTATATAIAVRFAPDSATKSSADSSQARTQVSRGTGRLRGVVRRPNGTPVAGARLLLWGSGLEEVTGADGAYALRALPTGTRTLEARALGFLRLRLAVDVPADSEAVADLTMETFVALLDTVKVTAQRVYQSPQRTDFERRRKSGFGYFLDEDAINRRSPIYTADLFRMVPGVSVLPSQGFGHSVTMRSATLSGGSYCVPAFFIDGIRVMVDDGNLDQVVNEMDIRAVEVYSRASNVPPQFNTMTGCGSIVIHTGGRSQPK